MIVIIWVFGFFSIMSLVIGTFREDYIHLIRYTKIFKERVKEQDAERAEKACACLDSLIATKVKKRNEESSSKIKEPKEKDINSPIKEKVFLNVIPHTSRFNLAVFFKQDQEMYKKALMRFLKISMGNYAESFIDELTIKGQWMRASSKKPDPTRVIINNLQDVAKIVFTQQKVVYKFLKEDLQRYCLFEADRNRYIISIHYASEEVLTAILDDPFLAADIVRMREAKYLKGKRFLKSNKKTLVSNEFLTKSDIETLFKDYNKELSLYTSILDTNIHIPHRADLAKDTGIPADL